MFLKKISLTNFRNYSECEFEFKTPVTILLGNNTQGKSNFLESIYFLSTTKSPKADLDMDLIKKGEEVARVEGMVESGQGTENVIASGSAIAEERSNLDEKKDSDVAPAPRNDNEETNLEIAMQVIEGNLTKRVKVNGIPRRVVDYIGNLSVVSFSPEDINLVTGSPSLRRWHIDLTLAQIDRSYKSALTNYGEIITRKNRLLKMIREGEASVGELEFWVSQQLEFGEIVQRKRKLFFEFLNSSERNFGELLFEYQESTLNKERLEEYQSREIAAAASLIGPHRDDFKFVSGERDLAKFGSRGEHRTAVLDLKLTEASFIETVIGSRPILLLDDVFSELDFSHQEHVLDLIKLQQTVIAGVELPEGVRESLGEAAIFSVHGGKLDGRADRSQTPPKRSPKGRK